MRKVVEDVKLFMEVAGQQIGDATDPDVPRVGNPKLERALWDAERTLDYVVIDLKDLKDLEPSDQLVALRARLVLEETREFVNALVQGDTVGVADAIVDLIYVATGGSVAFGIDQAAVWSAVQAANMAKAHPCPENCGRGFGSDDETPCKTCRGRGVVMKKDAGGKVIKSEGWTPPDVVSILEGQRRGKVDPA